MADVVDATMILYHMPHDAVYDMKLTCCYKGLKHSAKQISRPVFNQVTEKQRMSLITIVPK